MTTTTAQPTGTCTRCHRTLTDPKSIERGRGPVCERKHQAAIEAATKLTSPSIVGRALALAANGGLAKNAADSFYTVTTEHGSYRTDRTLCTCLSGQNGRPCHHLVAVCLVEAKAVRLPA